MQAESLRYGRLENLRYTAKLAARIDKVYEEDRNNYRRGQPQVLRYEGRLAIPSTPEGSTKWTMK